jgi:hypothetical protein
MDTSYYYKMNTSTITPSSSTDSFSELIQNLENNQIQIDKEESNNICQKIYNYIKYIYNRKYKND